MPLSWGALELSMEQVPYDVVIMLNPELPQFLRSCRLLRLARIVKAVRVLKNLHFIQELQNDFGISFTAVAIMKWAAASDLSFNFSIVLFILTFFCLSFFRPFEWSF
jgi:hypothetical protein